MFRSIIFSALISIILTAAAFGQTSASWQKVTSTAGHFEAIFPAAPRNDFRKLKTDSGNFASMTLYTAEVGSDSYFVTYSDYSERLPDPKTALVNSQEGVVGKNSLVFSTPSTFMGHSALDYQVRTRDGIVMTVKAVLVGQRLYQIAAARLEASPTASDNAKFVSSFRLKIPSGVAGR